MVEQLGLAGLHGATGDEDHRHVEAHGGHQHSRGDLVAVGDAHQGIGTVGVDHVLDAVGDQVATRQRVEHAVVAHGDAVVHGDGVELLGHPAGLLDLAGHQLPHVLQVHMPRHELGEGVGHGDDRLVEVLVLHAGGTPQGAGAGHVAAGGGGAGTILGHGVLFSSSLGGRLCRRLGVQVSRRFWHAVGHQASDSGNDQRVAVGQWPSAVEHPDIQRRAQVLQQAKRLGMLLQRLAWTDASVDLSCQ